ncbi:hypothetical protein [Pseudarthrobacter sp. MDT3-1]
MDRTTRNIVPALRLLLVGGLFAMFWIIFGAGSAHAAAPPPPGESSHTSDGLVPSLTAPVKPLITTVQARTEPSQASTAAPAPAPGPASSAPPLGGNTPAAAPVRTATVPLTDAPTTVQGPATVIQEVTAPVMGLAGSSVAPLTAPVTELITSTVQPLLGPVTGLAGSSVAPLTAPVTELITSTVQPLLGPVTGLAGSSVAPLTAPVTELITSTVQPLLGPVTGLAGSSVAPLTAPVTELITSTVQPLLGPVTGLAGSSVAPLTAPVTELITSTVQPLLAPVTGLAGSFLIPVANPVDAITHPVAGLINGTTSAKNSPGGADQSTTVEFRPAAVSSANPSPSTVLPRLLTGITDGSAPRGAASMDGGGPSLQSPSGFPRGNETATAPVLSPVSGGAGASSPTGAGAQAAGDLSYRFVLPMTQGGEGSLFSFALPGSPDDDPGFSPD